MSKLKKARNLLDNPHASIDNLRGLAAEMTSTLVISGSTLDNKIKEEYQNLIARLTIRAGKEEGNQPAKNEEKKKHRQKYLNKNSSAQVNNSSKESHENSRDDFHNYSKSDIIIPGGMDNKYTLPDFFPDGIKQGYIWLNYVNMKLALKLNKRMVMPDKTELIFTRDFPNYFIGDLFVHKRRQINSYKALLEVEPTLNPERIRKLYEFYMENEEYRPMHKGELFWTRTHPVKANRPQNNYIADGKKIMPSKISEHLVKVKNFVIFVNGIDDLFLSSNPNVFDFVYTGTNNSNTSGRGFFIKDSIRKTVTEHLYRSIVWEK